MSSSVTDWSGWFANGELLEDVSPGRPDERDLREQDALEGDRAGGNRAGGDRAGGRDAEADEPAGIEPAGIEPAGIEPAGIEPAGIEPAGIEPAGIEPAGAERMSGVKTGSRAAGIEVYGAAAMPAGTDDWSLVRASTLTGLRVTLIVKSWDARSLPSAIAWIRNLY